MTRQLPSPAGANPGAGPPGASADDFRPAGSFDLAAYRRRRFAAGLQCPRCRSRSVQRWGRFGERRRYRCLGCRRTFSDLTGTPLAYLKRLDCWPSFCDDVLASRSIRWTAGATGIQPSTVFRWRHRLLEAVRAADRGRLEGDVAVGETCFPLSEKGRRNLERPPRRRRDPFWWLGNRVWVLLARDDAGRALAETTGETRPRITDMAHVLLPRLAPDARILDAAGPFGAAACLARREGRAYRRIKGRALLDHPAVSYGLQLRRWLVGFRGVAMKYLTNYLAWHRFLTLTERRRIAPSDARLLLITCSFP